MLSLCMFHSNLNVLCIIYNQKVETGLVNFDYFCSVVVRKSFIKHMCFIVLYFHCHTFFSLQIAQKVVYCALFFEKSGLLCFIF